MRPRMGQSLQRWASYLRNGSRAIQMFLRWHDDIILLLPKLLDCQLCAEGSWGRKFEKEVHGVGKFENNWEQETDFSTDQLKQKK